MVKIRMKWPTGNTVLFIGLQPLEVLKLLSCPLLVDGESLGLGKDVLISIMSGESPETMLQEIEQNMPGVEFP